MQFEMKFDMDNAAFEDEPAAEMEKIFREIHLLVAGAAKDGVIRDSNGNRIGDWEISGEALRDRIGTRVVGYALADREGDIVSETWADYIDAERHAEEMNAEDLTSFAEEAGMSEGDYKASDPDWPPYTIHAIDADGNSHANTETHMIGDDVYLSKA